MLIIARHSQNVGFEVEWKTTNEIWLAEQEKKDRKKKKSRLENEEDDDLEIVVDKFGDEDDFIPFEDDEDEGNAGHAKHARHAGHENLHGNLHTNHSFDDELLSRDFFDDMRDEYAL